MVTRAVCKWKIQAVDVFGASWFDLSRSNSRNWSPVPTLAMLLKGAAHRTGNARAHGGRSDGACDAPQRIRRYPVDPSRPRASQPRAISFVTGPARGSGLSRGQACQCASRDEFLRSGFFSPCGRGGHGGVREKLSELDTSLSRRVMA